MFEISLYYSKALTVERLGVQYLRKVNKKTVYLHFLGNEVDFGGSGVWFRCRRYSNRRNLEDRKLMKNGCINYRIVAEFYDKCVN